MQEEVRQVVQKKVRVQKRVSVSTMNKAGNLLKTLGWATYRVKMLAFTRIANTSKQIKLFRDIGRRMVKNLDRHFEEMKRMAILQWRKKIITSHHHSSERFDSLLLLFAGLQSKQCGSALHLVRRFAQRMSSERVERQAQQIAVVSRAPRLLNHLRPKLNNLSRILSHIFYARVSKAFLSIKNARRYEEESFYEEFDQKIDLSVFLSVLNRAASRLTGDHLHIWAQRTRQIREYKLKVESRLKRQREQQKKRNALKQEEERLLRAIHQEEKRIALREQEDRRKEERRLLRQKREEERLEAERLVRKQFQEDRAREQKIQEERRRNLQREEEERIRQLKLDQQRISRMRREAEQGLKQVQQARLKDEEEWAQIRRKNQVKRQEHQQRRRQQTQLREQQQRKRRLKLQRQKLILRLPEVFQKARERQTVKNITAAFQRIKWEGKGSPINNVMVDLLSPSVRVNEFALNSQSQNPNPITDSPIRNIEAPFTTSVQIKSQEHRQWRDISAVRFNPAAHVPERRVSRRSLQPLPPPPPLAQLARQKSVNAWQVQGRGRHRQQNNQVAQQNLHLKYLPKLQQFRGLAAMNPIDLGQRGYQQEIQMPPPPRPIFEPSPRAMVRPLSPALLDTPMMRVDGLVRRHSVERDFQVQRNISPPARLQALPNPELLRVRGRSLSPLARLSLPVQGMQFQMKPHPGMQMRNIPGRGKPSLGHFQTFRYGQPAQQNRIAGKFYGAPPSLRVMQPGPQHNMVLQPVQVNTARKRSPGPGSGQGPMARGGLSERQQRILAAGYEQGFRDGKSTCKGQQRARSPGMGARGRW